MPLTTLFYLLPDKNLTIPIYSASNSYYKVILVTENCTAIDAARQNAQHSKLRRKLQKADCSMQNVGIPNAHLHSSTLLNEE